MSAAFADRTRGTRRVLPSPLVQQQARAPERPTELLSWLLWAALLIVGSVGLGLFIAVELGCYS